MRPYFIIFTFILVTKILASNPLSPRVPATIEIAEVKLKITAEAQREIQKDVDALRASEKYFQIKLDRVNLYFPLIEKTLREEGVPDDLKYLAVQESALVSDAVSSADAVGYWQFKDFTAREVGMRVDGKVDERKNIISSTRGASVYFKRNNFLLKNWIYVVNAHMTGPTGVKKYVNQKDIGSDRMVISGKTHWYVKRFIAHVIAFKDEVGAPNSNGIKLLVYSKGKNKTLSQISREVKIDEPLLKEYNKWLKHGKIPDDRDYAVIIPVKGKIPSELKAENPDNTPPPLSRKIEEPLAKKGGKTIEKEGKNVFISRNDRKAVMATASDNMVSLSIKANILSRQLMKYNDMEPNQTITAGEVYYAQAKKNKSNIKFHVTGNEETLWQVSQRYGVKMNKILKKNRMKSADELKPGRVIWLNEKRPKDTPIAYKEVTKKSNSTKKPPARKPKIESPIPKPKPEIIEKVLSEQVVLPTAKETNPTEHLVQQGESLWGISREYNITVDNLKNWNQIIAADGLQPGQILRLYESNKSKETPSNQSKTEIKKIHKVASGDSLWGIAQQYGMTIDELKKLNNKESNELAIGEELIVE